MGVRASVLLVAIKKQQQKTHTNTLNIPLMNGTTASRIVNNIKTPDAEKTSSYNEWLATSLQIQTMHDVYEQSRIQNDQRFGQNLYWSTIAHNSTIMSNKAVTI